MTIKKSLGKILLKKVNNKGATRKINHLVILTVCDFDTQYITFDQYISLQVLFWSKFIIKVWPKQSPNKLDPDYISMHNSTLQASTENGTDTTQTLKSFKSELDDYVHCWLQSLARSRRRPWSNWLGWSYKRPRNHPFIERISLSPAKSCPHLSCTGRHCATQRDNLHFPKLSTNMRYFFTSPFPHNWDSQKDCKTKAKICWFWTL